jgi:ABC-type transport system involved in cytochrome bd biosynthesis fused ATPase/permease subunit
VNFSLIKKRLTIRTIIVKNKIIRAMPMVGTNSACKSITIGYEVPIARTNNKLYNLRFLIQKSSVTCVIAKSANGKITTNKPGGVRSVDNGMLTIQGIRNEDINANPYDFINFLANKNMPAARFI